MWTLKLTLVLACYVVLINAKAREIKIESIEFSPGSEEILTLTHSIKQLNATAFSVTADYDQKVDIDNKYDIQVVVSMVTRGNSFFEVYRTKPQGVCDFMKSAGNKVAPDMGAIELCPIEKGQFSVADQEFDVGSLLKMALPGRFKIDIILTEAKAEKLKATMIVEMK